MTLRPIAALIASLLLLSPALAETYRYEGKLENKVACSGQVTFDDSGASLQVTQTVQVGKRTLRYRGVGQRSGGRILANLRGVEGITGRLTGESARNLPQSMFLTFEPIAEGKQWRLRGSVDAQVWLRGWGQESAVEPGKVTVSNASHQEIRGVPFLKGAGDSREIDKNDVQQGQLGDCYFLAALLAAADCQPERIRRQLRVVSPNESQIYLCKRWISVSHDLVLSRFGSQVYTKTDSVYRDGQRVFELWPALYEKALALEGGGYEEIEGGMVWTGLKQLGYDTKTILPLVNISSRMRKALNKALQRKQPITIAFPPAIERTSTGKRLGIVGSHVYAITGATPDGRKFYLHNPWGHSHPSGPLSPSDMRKLLSIVSIGK